MKRTLMMAAFAVLALNLAACKDEAKSETTETVVDAQGTKTQTKSSAEVEYNRDGTTNSQFESKTTVDPEGVMNKETVHETQQETTAE